MRYGVLLVCSALLQVATSWTLYEGALRGLDREATSGGLQKAAVEDKGDGKSAVPDRVQIGFYSESLCPYCRQFTSELLAPMFTNGLSSIAKINYYPFGNARYDEARPSKTKHRAIPLCIAELLYFSACRGCHLDSPQICPQVSNSVLSLHALPAPALLPSLDLFARPEPCNVSTESSSAT